MFMWLLSRLFQFSYLKLRKEDCGNIQVIDELGFTYTVSKVSCYSNIKDFCVIGFISSLGFRSFDSTGYKPTFDYGFYNANG